MLGACTVLLAADKAAAAVISLPFHTITADYCRPAPAATQVEQSGVVLMGTRKQFTTTRERGDWGFWVLAVTQSINSLCGLQGNRGSLHYTETNICKYYYLSNHIELKVVRCVTGFPCCLAQSSVI